MKCSQKSGWINHSYERIFQVHVHVVTEFTVSFFDKNNLEILDFRVFDSYLLLLLFPVWLLFRLMCLLFVGIYTCVFVFLGCLFRCCSFVFTMCFFFLQFVCLFYCMFCVF